MSISKIPALNRGMTAIVTLPSPLPSWLLLESSKTWKQGVENYNGQQVTIKSLQPKIGFLADSSRNFESLFR